MTAIDPVFDQFPRGIQASDSPDRSVRFPPMFPWALSMQTGPSTIALEPPAGRTVGPLYMLEGADAETVAITIAIIVMDVEKFRIGQIVVGFRHRFRHRQKRCFPWVKHKRSRQGQGKMEQKVQHFNYL